MQLFKLKRHDKLPPAERLLASLLCRDQERFKSCAYLLKSHNAEFIDLLLEHNLVSIVFHELTIRGAVSIFKDLKEASLFSIMNNLRQKSAIETIAYHRFDEKFTRFISRIGELQDALIWLKGIVTSRTLFPPEITRISSDFDFFVLPGKARQLEEAVNAAGYNRIYHDAGCCNQLGVGPTFGIEQAFFTPAPEMVPSAVVGFENDGWPMVDVKFNPLDRGLRMVEIDRFISNAILIKWNGIEFKAPDLLDQLMITLTHYEKDRFESWKSLVDIGVLVEKIGENPEQWAEFVRRCKVEGIQTSCWAALFLATERLSLQNVDEVLTALAPSQINMAKKLFFFTVTALFYWNTSSLPMLVLNAAVADDSSRKVDALKKSIFPSKEFLSQYYAGGRSLSSVSAAPAMLAHWAVLFLPGGVVRHTFGKILWHEPDYQALTEAAENGGTDQTD